MNFWRKKKKSRGASSERVKASRSIDFRWFYRLFNGFVIALVLTGVYYASINLIDRPVARVVVNGDFHYVEKSSVIEEVTPFLGDGFVLLDLDGIREKLLQRPWVFDVTVSRQWPDEIVIEVVEQNPIARWGESGFLNHRGNLFVPTESVDDVLTSSLPMVVGPEQTTEQVMGHYRELSDMLNQYDLKVEQLEFGARGDWELVISNALDNHQVAVFLGVSDVMAKMRRLINVYQLTLLDRFEQVKRIDMRYSNGLAVQWDESSNS